LKILCNNHSIKPTEHHVKLPRVEQVNRIWPPTPLDGRPCVRLGWFIESMPNVSPWWWCLWGELCWCLTGFSYSSYHRKPTEQEFFVPAPKKMLPPEFFRTQIVVNSLPAFDAHERQLFDKLLWGLVTSTIFVRC
jgi:hypothetical protein